FLAEKAREIPQVAGTRMMGGGFGGCTINIVETGSIDGFSKKIKDEYNKQFGKTPEVYITQIEDGVSLL
ncbi:MAG TPA: galactokinase, partial [Flavitalea sp.]|nr:galactokinase [Flavitalea sp.]